MVEQSKKFSVLFVCMGNICRSPTAEGVFRKLVSDANLDEHIHADSAGTHAYHSGEPPDRRAQAAAERRGVSLADISARRLAEEDFERFDYILAMDEDNLQLILEAKGDEHATDVRLFLEFAEGALLTEVPDPYYGGTAGFEKVLDLVEHASRGLLETLQSKI